MRVTKGRAWSLLTIASALMVAVTPMVAATHNSAGFLVSANTAPTEIDGPDVPDDMLPVWHRGTSVERLSPLDQSGLGYQPERSGAGECDPGGANPCYIGYFDGIIEQYVVLWPFVWNLFDDDPLYRANPAPGDEGCDSLNEQTNPDHSACDGTGHTLGFGASAIVHFSNGDVTKQTGLTDGSGFMYPGLHIVYAYMFGDGSGDYVAGGESFEELPANACAGRTVNCRLLTKDDIAARADAVSGKTGTVCWFYPQQRRANPDNRDSGCGIIGSRFGGPMDDFKAGTQVGNYIVNKPGWYAGMLSGVSSMWFGNEKCYAPGAHNHPFVGHANYGHHGGDCDAPGYITEFWVNPSPPSGDLWCLEPRISKVNGVYQVDAFDIDIYTSPIRNDVDGIWTTEDTVWTTVDQGIAPILQIVNNALGPLGAIVGPITDEAGERTDMFQAQGAEPNAPGDNQAGLSRPFVILAGDPECNGEGDLLQSSGIETIQGNALLSTIRTRYEGVATSGPLRDPSATSVWNTPAGPVPFLARDDETSQNPWHPGSFDFVGSINVVEDFDEDGSLEACPAQGAQTTATVPDLCLARLAWDMYNPSAVTASQQVVGDYAREQGYADPTGLFFVLLTTGPTAVYDKGFSNAVLQSGRFNERLHLLTGSGQHCVVGTSDGLTEGTQGGLFREVLGLAPTATEAEILTQLCGPLTTGEKVLIDDAFAPQNGFGDFVSAVAWTQLVPKTPAFSDGDGLTVSALLTTKAGLPDGTTDTRDNVQLGTHSVEGQDTLVKVWPTGERTYLWTDRDPFVTTVE